MSAPHATDHGHRSHAQTDIGYHATTRGYVVGFALSAVLTAIPFWLVMGKVLPASVAGIVILAFAAVQMIVHMIYFLHLNAKAEGGWSLLALLFTLALLVIMLAGSVWVMYHLNTNMMPVMDPQTMRNMP
ncbi:MAG TPA: cytochrome o ubiquinol oxidase subunit IV [Ramlibacter sp.]|nr:cytochrome o ubiquinol oxidase subunit IV [Ramlibacter sp.]